METTAELPTVMRYPPARNITNCGPNCHDVPFFSASHSKHFVYLDSPAAYRYPWVRKLTVAPQMWMDSDPGSHSLAVDLLPRDVHYSRDLLFFADQRGTQLLNSSCMYGSYPTVSCWVSVKFDPSNGTEFYMFYGEPQTDWLPWILLGIVLWMAALALIGSRRAAEVAG